MKDGLKKSGLVGTATMKRKFYEPGPLCEADDESTLTRARISLNLYFSLVKEANQQRWDMGRPGFLCTNPGVRGYLMLLASLIKFIEKKKKIDAKVLDPVDLIIEVEEYLEPVIVFVSSASDSEFEELFKVKYGSGGAPQYYFKLVQLVNEETREFLPDGYDDYLQSQSEEKIKRADGIVKELQTIIPAYIFNKFKKRWPDGDYLEKGVPNVKMRTKAYEKQQSDDPAIRSPKLETYFEFLDLKKIVEATKNWHFLKDVFDIPIPEKKGLNKNTAWMDRINELRRIQAHGFGREYKVEDFDFLDWIYDKFKRNLELAKQKKSIETRTDVIPPNSARATV